MDPRATLQQTLADSQGFITWAGSSWQSQGPALTKSPAVLALSWVSTQTPYGLHPHGLCAPWPAALKPVLTPNQLS